MPVSISETGRAKPPFPSAIEPISMRISDACRFTGISRSTLYLMIARQDVEVIKLGASTLVLTESLRRLIEGRRKPKVHHAEQS